MKQVRHYCDCCKIWVPKAGCLTDYCVRIRAYDEPSIMSIKQLCEMCGSRLRAAVADAIPTELR